MVVGVGLTGVEGWTLLSLFSLALAVLALSFAELLALPVLLLLALLLFLLFFLRLRFLLDGMVERDHCHRKSYFWRLLQPNAILERTATG